ncbi:MAG: phospholipid carrier-dependent glycosyltransferase [Anaerolineales bacterium]
MAAVRGEKEEINMGNPDFRMERKKNHRRVFFLFDALFLALLGAYVFLGMTRVPFHVDESTLIRLSMDFAYIFQDRAIQKVIYHPTTGFWSVEQYQRELTGSIDPLTIGMAWSAAGMDRGDLNGFWVWLPPDVNDEWAFNVQIGNMPGIRLLDISRIPSTLFTAISIAVVFFIALGLSRSRPAAWIAAFLYATTPSILVNGRRAMQEGGLLLFTSLVVFGTLYILRLIREEKLRWRRIIPGFGLFGLASGLALASKHTSALVIAPAFFAIFILLWFAGGELESREKTAVHFRLLFGLLGSGLLGLSVFYILMPVWWLYPFNWLVLLCLSAVCFTIGLPKPGWGIWIARTISIAGVLLISVFAAQAWNGIYQPIGTMLQIRAEIMFAQQALGRDMSTAESRIGEMADQLLFAKTQYYESHTWDGLEEEQTQIRVYEDAHLDGRGGGMGWGIVVLVLVVGGLWVTLFRRRGWETLLLLSWLAVPAAILLLTNPLPFQRYYIVLIAPWSVLAGFAAVPFTTSDFLGSVRKFLVWRNSAAKSD